MRMGVQDQRAAFSGRHIRLPHVPCMKLREVLPPLRSGCGLGEFANAFSGSPAIDLIHGKRAPVAFSELLLGICFSDLDVERAQLLHPAGASPVCARVHID